MLGLGLPAHSPPLSVHPAPPFLRRSPPETDRSILRCDDLLPCGSRLYHRLPSNTLCTHTSHTCAQIPAGSSVIHVYITHRYTQMYTVRVSVYWHRYTRMYTHEYMQTHISPCELRMRAGRHAGGRTQGPPSCLRRGQKLLERPPWDGLLAFAAHGSPPRPQSVSRTSDVLPAQPRNAAPRRTGAPPATSTEQPPCRAPRPAPGQTPEPSASQPPESGEQSTPAGPGADRTLVTSLTQPRVTPAQRGCAQIPACGDGEVPNAGHSDVRSLALPRR